MTTTVLLQTSQVLWPNNTDEIMKAYSWSQQTHMNPILLLFGISVDMRYSMSKLWMLSKKKIPKAFTSYFIGKIKCGRIVIRKKIRKNIKENKRMRARQQNGIC